MLAILLLLALPQTTQKPARPAPELGLYAGAVEAPVQPQGVSSSTVTRGPRLVAAPGAGTAGRVTVRVGDLVAVRGQEENQIQGLGLVTGLSGTGDATTAARQAIINLLKTQNIVLDLQAVASANTAVVLVQATLEPGIKPGRQMDVRVSSLYDCESLVGGILLATELTDVTGTKVYATAAGPVTTGAFSAEGQGASATRNHLTVGTIPLGGKVEREVPTQMVSDHGFVYLDLRALKGSFENATRIATVLNGLYPSMAIAQDPMTVAVRVPGDLPKESTVSFISSLLSQEIEPAAFARVVVNERTGVIVMGEGVRISRGAITKGNLTVTIAETPEASQPGPLSNGKTEVLPRTSLLVDEEDRPLTIVNGAVTLAEVVEVLNVLGVTPRDMIQILQLMAQSGMLHAEVLVM